MGPALRVSVLALVVALSGCASTNPKDPFETFNRTMFGFNDALDRTAVKPAAEVYSKLPSFVQTGVGNFFGNLSDVWTAANNFMQGKVGDGFSDVMRVSVNTFLGLGGLLDIGSEAGLPKHREDFGQTLGKWGIGPGPYVVLLVLGSTTLRDTFALPVDYAGDPWHHVDPLGVRTSGSIVRAIDFRASVLDASTLIEEAALDRYQFVRDAYLQRRQNKVYDGDPPSSAYEDDVGLHSQGGEANDRQDAKGNDKVEPATPAVVKLEPNSVSETAKPSSVKEANKQ